MMCAMCSSRVLFSWYVWFKNTCVNALQTMIILWLKYAPDLLLYFSWGPKKVPIHILTAIDYYGYNQRLRLHAWLQWFWQSQFDVTCPNGYFILKDLRKIISTPIDFTYVKISDLKLRSERLTNTESDDECETSDDESAADESAADESATDDATTTTTKTAEDAKSIAESELKDLATDNSNTPNNIYGISLFENFYVKNINGSSTKLFPVFGMVYL